MLFWAFVIRINGFVRSQCHAIRALRDLVLCTRGIEFADIWACLRANFINFINFQEYQFLFLEKVKRTDSLSNYANMRRLQLCWTLLFDSSYIIRKMKIIKILLALIFSWYFGILELFIYFHIWVISEIY